MLKRTLTTVAPAACVLAVFLTAEPQAVGDGKASPTATPIPASVSAARKGPAATLGRLPLVFEENRGQAEGPSSFFARRGPITTYFEPRGFVINAQTEVSETSQSGVALFLTFEGASDARIEGETPLPGIVNRFHGDDPELWRTDIPTFGGLRYRDLYPGVDVEIRDGGGSVEYNLVLAPGAPLDGVVCRVDGADRLDLVDGVLIARTARGDLRQHVPATWQTKPGGVKETLHATFRLIDGRRFGFEVEGRDPEAELVVDPLLIFGSYLGGAGIDEVHGVAVDPAGSAYLVGRTSSSDYPRTPGCYDNVKNGSYEAFVTKLNPAGSALVYSTYLGSNGSDLAEDVVVTPAGEAIVTGWLGGSAFPVTAGAYDTTYNGFSDTFITKFSVSGNSLVYSTVLGGSNEDRPNGIALCADGAVVVCGQTMSTNFPTLAGAHDTTHNGSWDAYVFKLSAAGNAALMSTYIGGSGIDWAFGVALAPDGSPVVCGGTNSANFPAVGAPYDASHNGGFDGFVAKFNPGAGTLAWCGFLGGAGSDQAFGVDVDVDGGVYVAGTCGVGFPTTPGAFDVANDGGEAFLVKLAPGGGSLVYATLLGGSSTEQANAVKVDVVKAAYVVGFTNSSNFPTTTVSYDPTFNGGGSPAEGFLTKFDHEGKQLLMSTYIGSAANDEARSLALDAAQAVYVVGLSQGEMAFPSGGFDVTPNGGDEGFLLKLDVSPAAIAASLAAGCNVGSAQPPGFSCTAPVLGQTAVASGYGAPPNQAGVMLVSTTPTQNAFFGFGCVLQLSTVTIGLLSPLTSSSTGTWTLETAVAPVPANAGSIWRVQGVFLSPTHPLGFVFTNAMEMTLGY